MIVLTSSQLSLFVGEFFESLGDTLNLEWVIKGKLWSGTYCDAQGTDSLQVHSLTLKMFLIKHTS
jgi:hypothetical protein